MRSLLSVLFLIFLAACHEDVGGVRQFEPPEEETETPQGEAPGTILVRCLAQDETELLYLIRARNNSFDVANCTGTRENESCETNRVQVEITSTGEGNEQRPCFSQSDDNEAFSLCLSTRNDTPNDPTLVRMAGREFESVFEFVCEETIRTILR